MLVSAAGTGKTTALDASRPEDGIRRRAADLLADARSGVLLAHGEGWVGVDDLHELPARDQGELVARLHDLPSTTSITIASRVALPAEVRAALRFPVRERGARDLELSSWAVARVLSEEYGLTDPDLPAQVHALTLGWPALVHAVADHLVSAVEPVGEPITLDPDLWASAAAATGWLTTAVREDLPGDWPTMLDCTASVGPVTEAICTTLATALGLELGGATLQDLTRSGIVGASATPTGPVFAVVPMLAGAVTDPLWDRADPRVVAAAYESGGQPYAAAVAHLRAGNHAQVERLVAEFGEGMLREGRAAAVISLLSGLPVPGSDRVALIRADALRITGDLAAANRAFAPLVAAAGSGRWARPLASRVAAVPYAAGQLEEALASLDRAEPPGDRDTDAEDVEWLASRAHMLTALGRRAEAEPLALRALRTADASGDPRALTAAHLARARVSSASRKAAHHDAALRAARESGDQITASRILVNQACQELAGARYAVAVVTARAALEASDVGIATGRRAAALHNLAEGLMHLGEYDEARWHLDRAVSLCRRLGPGRTALGLLGLADTHRHQGHDEQARARYLEAVELARASRELQVLVPALAGLARLEAFAAPGASATTSPEAPGAGSVGIELAQELVVEAVALATPALLPHALTAAGWAALRAGDRSRAAAHAAASVDAARADQAFDLLAEALELAGTCADDPDTARRHLLEAHGIWTDGGAAPASRRVEAMLGWLEGADSADRMRGREAVTDLRRRGVHQVYGRSLTAEGSPATVAVAVLGVFRVSVGGAEVPLAAWRSKQARTLVKILAARRGRPATREWLREALWPDDDPARTGHRLSVLLATVRTVLDPRRQWPVDRYVAADLTGVWLDVRHVSLDADLVIRDADHAARLLAAADSEDDPSAASLAVSRACALLSDLDRRYTGEAFEDEPSQPWADGLREEARAAWLQSLRRLANRRGAQGRTGEAETLLIRLLAADPHDERVHRMLVRTLLRAGRHGEARRAFDRWTQAMVELGAPPPDPSVLLGRPVVVTSR